MMRSIHLRRVTFSLLLTCALTLAAAIPIPGSPPAGGAASPGRARLAPELYAALAAAPDGQAEALVYLRAQADLSFAYGIEDWNERGWAVYRALKEVADRTQPAVLEELSRLEAAGAVTRVQPFWVVNLIDVRGNREALEALAARPDVEHVLPPMRLEAPKTFPGEPELHQPNTPEWGIQKIGAVDVWNTYGITGTGAVAANLDTGVEYTHPALVRNYRGNLGGGQFDHNYNWWDYNGSPYPNAVGGEGHGTHVMGTEVGWDGGANQIGVAPGAKWIAAYGCCPDNPTMLSASQWMIAPTDLQGNNPRPDLRPHVIQNSYGFLAGGGPTGQLLFYALLERQRAAGIFPSYSAGNNGPACGTVAAPGDNPFTFGVAATTSTDAIASFSSRGPSPYGGTEPDVAAPGVNVRSSVPGGGYASLSGTSMAGPHNAGAVALLISVEPKLAGQIEQLEELLRQTAKRIVISPAQTCGGVSSNTFPNNAVGWGRINVKAAADMVWHAGWLRGRVTNASNQGLAGVTISVSRQIVTQTYTLTTKTDPQGYYSLVLGEGAYNVQADLWGYTPQSASAVAVTQNNVTTQNFTLSAVPTYEVTGNLHDQGTGLGLYGAVTALDAPLDKAINHPTAFSDPVTGAYSLSLPQGTHVLKAISQNYASQQVTVTVNGPIMQHFFLNPIAGYSCADSRQAGGPTYEWIDATDSYSYTLGDNSTRQLNLPAPFTYYGISYNSAITRTFAGSNGTIIFGVNNSTPILMLPYEGAPHNFINVLAEDLNPALGAQGRVYTKTVTVNNQTLYVVEWHQVEHWLNGDPETFEAILNLSDHSIKLQYHTLSWPDFTGVGLENANGTVGHMYSFNDSGHLENALAVEFRPVTGRPPRYGCDHALVLAGSPSWPLAPAGSPVVYTLAYNVVSTGAAPGAVLTATVPSESRFLWADYGVTPVNGVLTWNLGNLPPNARGKIHFAVVPRGTPANLDSVARLSDASGLWRQVTIPVDNYYNNTTYELFLPIVTRN